MPRKYYRRFDREKIIEMSKQGIEDKRIAKELGCSIHTIRSARRGSGTQAAKPTYGTRQSTLERKTKIRQLKQRGYSYKQIAEVMGVSRQRIQQLLAPTAGELKMLLSRSNGKCERCGAEAQTLHAHHEDYLGAPDEMLCLSCHGKTHGEQSVVTEQRITPDEERLLLAMMEEFGIERREDVLHHIIRVFRAKTLKASKLA